ncbi:MAG: MoaF N-terminal domain-containing protein [Lachnospiraceae bacterium]|nr:MoaF N-terminal domain-containing protein [Lachnospiraceae bacterium]
MNLMEKFGPLAAKESIRQFSQPRCYEFAGKEFNFVVDTGEETGHYQLRFIDKQQLEWSKEGSEPNTTAYECRKSDDDTYLLTYNYEGKEPRENHTWVIDMENELVTFLRCALGENPMWPLLVDSHFGFGFIQFEGKEHTDIRRHGFTNDVTGTAVRWTYGNSLATVHVYHDPHWYRIGYPVGENRSADGASGIRALMMEMPSSDEPCYYVKIKEGMYLVSCTEQNLEKLLGARFGFRSDTLCFLDNWKQLISVGRAFGTWTKEGEDKPLLMMIGKYGSQVEVEERFFTDPIPYLI